MKIERMENKKKKVVLKPHGLFLRLCYVALHYSTKYQKAVRDLKP